MDSVWCGDALFVNRRLDALTLLAAVAGRTERVLLGPACMGSFALRNPLVFAYEWASLDVLSNGRTRLVACAGGGAGPLWEAETAALGIRARRTAASGWSRTCTCCAISGPRTTSRSRASS